MRGATILKIIRSTSNDIFLLTRPLRGATTDKRSKCVYCYISTHTPLAGRDKDGFRSCPFLWNFYSHAPCGARLIPNPAIFGLLTFLLTRPLRGATLHQSLIPAILIYFYSHAPCGARHTIKEISDNLVTISTHTPLAGRDIWVSR